MKKLLAAVFIFLITQTSNSQTYEFDNLVTGLIRPTAFAFLPNGNVIVNQQHDSSKIYTLNNQLVSCFWNFKDSCAQGSESGLIGVCLDPDYSVNRYIYFYYIHTLNANLHRIVRLTENTNTGTNPTIIFSDSSGVFGGIHFAGNM